MTNQQGPSHPTLRMGLLGMVLSGLLSILFLQPVPLSATESLAQCGPELWSHTIAGEINFAEMINATVVDSAGNVYLTVVRSAPSKMRQNG